MPLEGIFHVCSRTPYRDMNVVTHQKSLLISYVYWYCPWDLPDENSQSNHSLADPAYPFAFPARGEACLWGEGGDL